MERKYVRAGDLLKDMLANNYFSKLDLEIYDCLYIPAIAEAYWDPEWGYQRQWYDQSEFFKTGLMALASRIHDWKKNNRKFARLRLKAFLLMSNELFFRLMRDGCTDKAFLCLKAAAFAQLAIREMDYMKIIRRYTPYFLLDEKSSLHIHKHSLGKSS